MKYRAFAAVFLPKIAFDAAISFYLPSMNQQFLLSKHVYFLLYFFTMPNVHRENNKIRQVERKRKRRRRSRKRKHKSPASWPERLLFRRTQLSMHVQGQKQRQWQEKHVVAITTFAWTVEAVATQGDLRGLP